MDSRNPYSAPASELSGKATTRGNRLVDIDTLAAEFSRALPWMKLMIGIGALVTGLTALSVLMAAFQNPGADVAVAAVTVALYGLPTYQLFRLQDSLSRFEGVPQVETLHAIARAQTRFWKTIGALTVLALGLFAVLFLAIYAFGLTEGYPYP